MWLRLTDKIKVAHIDLLTNSLLLTESNPTQVIVCVSVL